MFVHECTVFNVVYNKEKRLEELSTAHIYGIHWEDNKSVNVVKSGMSDADKVEIYIPMSAKTDKKYKQPKKFEKNSDGCFTLRPGDIIVKGIVEYKGAVAKLSNEFDNSIVITSVDTFDYGKQNMKHWKVSGK